jgi:hypothetical protein
MKNLPPSPNMEIILQQVLRSHMMSLLHDYFCYNQIKVKWVEDYKTTFIIDWCTVAHERMFSGLLDASTTFKIPI